MKYKATVFIPTYFAENTLFDLLDSVFSQDVDFEFEVAICDTSSTDRTSKIIEEFSAIHSNLRSKTIAKADFSHGKVRSAAIKEALGEIIVFLTQDAVPASKHWLSEMVYPFSISHKVGCVLGKQIPQNYAPPLIKSEIRQAFSNQGVDHALTIYYRKDIDIQNIDNVLFDVNSFYSDVNSATRTQLVLDNIQYPEVNYAEDQIFCNLMLNKGFIKIYNSKAEVIHSNDIPLKDYKFRIFDEVFATRMLGQIVTCPSQSRIIKNILGNFFKDIKTILRDKEYKPIKRFYWLVFNSLYRIKKWQGIKIACRVNLNDSIAQKKFSLESIQQKRHEEKQGK
jgi:rhamnosyltransferase